ncbi:MAG: hypothetical protein HGB01_06655 [Chlorobiaceae bacterium]|nr:hypothetical protein [Chlorobiaceae bacterium]
MSEKHRRNVQQQHRELQAGTKPDVMPEPIQKAPGMTVKYRAVDPVESGRRTASSGTSSGGKKIFVGRRP